MTLPALPWIGEAMHAEHQRDERARQCFSAFKGVDTGLKPLDQRRRGGGLGLGVRGGGDEGYGARAQSPRLSKAPGGPELHRRAIADECVDHAMGGVNHRGYFGWHECSARLMEPQEIPQQPHQKQPDHPVRAGQGVRHVKIRRTGHPTSLGALVGVWDKFFGLLFDLTPMRWRAWLRWAGIRPSPSRALPSCARSVRDDAVGRVKQSGPDIFRYVSAPAFALSRPTRPSPFHVCGTQTETTKKVCAKRPL